ncbi:uncharacterized protein [Lolium perenne]|uniref:uncharacterized protein n=1 Tax=Lolium perenne TaxID=4522 RepID=UPI0021EAC069|nr:uncharacterized protein LOC127307939 [Lolium perenne]XP_051194666.1 uncharacterized protein LOC127307939 [Lolium perenne]
MEPDAPLAGLRRVRARPCDPLQILLVLVAVLVADGVRIDHRQAKGPPPVTAAVVRLRRLLPHPTLRRLLPHQTLAAELRCTSGEVQNRKAKNQRVQARAFSPALAAAAEYPICIAARRASEVRLVPGDRGLLCPSAGPLDPATAAAISRLLARIGAGDEGDGGCRGSAGSSLASSAPSRGRGGHQEDAVELGKFACCFPTTKLRRGCAAATYRSCCQRPPFHAPVANDDLPYKLLLVQIILEEEMWGVKVLYREVVSVANTIGNILKCNVQALRWLRID